MKVNAEIWKREIVQLRADQARLVQWGQGQFDLKLCETLRDLAQEHDSCLRAYVDSTLSLDEIAPLRRARRVVQAASDRHLNRRPPAWQLWRHRAWEREHERRHALLRAALDAEQDAYARMPDKMHASLSKRVQWLRSQVEALEPIAAPRPAPEVSTTPEKLAEEVVEKLRQRKAALGPTLH